jgi:SNF2 family DNA or RNA helicase
VNVALPVPFPVGSWAWHARAREPVRIIEVDNLWGQTIYLVGRVGAAGLERVPASDLELLEARRDHNLDRLLVAVAAARVADAITQDVLLAPLEAGVIPLPHQLHVLSRCVAGEQVRFLLADEVGLGKTIEAGLIFKELKLRGLVRRALVVAPKSLVPQWVQEMRAHFHETFELFVPGDFGAGRQLTPTANLWKRFDQVVCPLDAIKPLEKRKGWSAAKVEQHNQDRLGDLIAAGWDLIVIDEAHRLGGSTEQIARYRLGKALAEAAPYLLLLSATPHQGKTAAFQRLMALLDKEVFVEGGAPRRDQVAPFVIRTEKRKTIDEQGRPLFPPRQTHLLAVRWEERHQLQRQLYESVSAYVRHGYDQAIRHQRQCLGFLLLLMQRLVTSSTRAVAATLRRRLEVLQPGEPGCVSAGSEVVTGEEEAPDTDLHEHDAQQQLEELLATPVATLANEQEEVRLLLDLAERCLAQGPDARAEALGELLGAVQRQENDPECKFLIFTEFVPTQEMLRDFLREQGYTVACLNGELDLDQRAEVQEQFAHKVRVLVSTDAGGEGLNLQFAHVVINYDLPWSPMRIEQRIGRVDRIGQKHKVLAFNLVFADSVEMRVQTVLEKKLQIIFREFGIDKTRDVLDSTASEPLFEQLYAEALLHPERLEERADELLRSVREQAETEQAGCSLYRDTSPEPNLARQFAQHPLPSWVERMTTAHIRAEGGAVAKEAFGFRVRWPGAAEDERVTFLGREATERGLRHLSMGDKRVRSLVERLVPVVPGQPFSVVSLKGIPETFRGYWSLWRIRLDADRTLAARLLPLFEHDDGRMLSPLATRLWDWLLEPAARIEVTGSVTGPRAVAAFGRGRAEAERQGGPLFAELLRRHRERLDRERKKGRGAFALRRRALEWIGLPEVRAFRLRGLGAEEAAWDEELRHRERFFPELRCVVLLRVEAGPN